MLFAAWSGLNRSMTENARPVTPKQLAWLDHQLPTWVAEGLIADSAAAALRARYVATRSLNLARLLLSLGSAFVGVGLIWLVATNLDEISPQSRFSTVTVLWLGVTAASEVLAARRAHAEAAGPSPVVGALRGLSALGYGAVVFQAAQSLQVPAYEPELLAAWGLGALLYAYACGGVAPLLVGVTVTTTWLIWTSVEQVDSPLALVLAMLVGGLVATALGVLHDARWRPMFAGAWRIAGAILVLSGLFGAALPSVGPEGFGWTTLMVGALIGSVALAAAAWLASRGSARGELAVPMLALPLATLLVLWDPALPDRGVVSGEAWLSALVSVATYVVAAGSVAVLGSLRDSTGLTLVATAALVIFTTVQSFAVFAPILSGATLFLLLGAILLATGYFFDRARRVLAGNLGGAPS